MRELRQDPIAGYWVAIAKERSHRPFDFVRTTLEPKAGTICPFCPGNEAMTPPALLVYPACDGGAWRLRVIPNKYPAIDAHEVVIESAEHKSTFGDLPESAAVDLLMAVRDRMLELRQDDALQYIQFFKNNGPGSGASLAHPHSQIIALPAIPPQLQVELDGSLGHYDREGRCIYCDLLGRDLKVERVIFQTEEAIAIAPYAPRFGFETWILPRRHDSHFEASDPATLVGVALLLHRTLRRIEAVLDRSPYNLLLHTAPVKAPGMPSYHWHFEILPRVSGIGGFEFGTGCYINAIPPEESAAVLRNL